MNLPGVIVDLPTVTDKDMDDIKNWGIPNQIDFIAASFVRKGQDIVNIRLALGEAAPHIKVRSHSQHRTQLEFQPPPLPVCGASISQSGPLFG